MELELVLDVRAHVVCLGERLQEWQQLQQTPVQQAIAGSHDDKVRWLPHTFPRQGAPDSLAALVHRPILRVAEPALDGDTVGELVPESLRRVVDDGNLVEAVW